MIGIGSVKFTKGWLLENFYQRLHGIGAVVRKELVATSGNAIANTFEAQLFGGSTVLESAYDLTAIRNSATFSRAPGSRAFARLWLPHRPRSWI